MTSPSSSPSGWNPTLRVPDTLLRRSIEGSPADSPASSSDAESLKHGEPSRTNMAQGKSDPLVDTSFKGASVRKRACKPKVRTGCVTCKVRRVKCDEGKPECRRCRVFGVKCDGYGIVPSASQLESARSLQPRVTETIGIQNPSEGVLFQTETESLYFRRFQEDIASGLSGTLETSLWNRLMLQACHDEPFVRSAVVAISAMSTSKSLTNSPSIELASQHTEFALQQYEKAIRIMRTSLTQPANNSPRRALIACLLVCCFESLAGHHFNTLGHAKSGHQLMRDWVARFPESQRQWDGITSPAPELVEDELIQAFTRLDNQVVTFFDSRSPEVHAELKDFGTSSIEKMPGVFSTVEEAQQYFTLIQARKCHFIHATAKHIIVDISADAAPYPIGPDPSRFFLEQRKHTMEFIHWVAAFEPLYQRLRVSPEPRLRLAVNVLYMHCKVSQITLNSQPDPNSCAYDKHVADFRAVVATIRGLVEEFYRPGVRRQQPYFVFDPGLIPVLHTINLHCRDRRIRRDSIALLKQMACREGVWDSLMMAAMDERLMQVEEENIETYYIPAKSRVTRLHVNIATDEKPTTIECVKADAAQAEEVLQFGSGKVEIAKLDGTKTDLLPL